MSLTSRRTVMVRKRYKPEKIVVKLWQVDVLVSQGQNIVDATTTPTGPTPQWDTNHQQQFRNCLRSASLASCKRHREASPGPTRKEMLASRRWSNKTPVRTRSARKRRGGGPSTWLRTVRHRLNSIGNRRMAEPSLWARTL